MVSLFPGPVFVFQWQFDEAQMTMNKVGSPVTPAQWNYIHRQGNTIRQTFGPLTAVFSPSCISHTVITKPDWAKVSIEGVTLPDALQCWVGQTLPGEQPLNTDGGDDDYLAGGKLAAPTVGRSGTPNHHYLRPLADSPLPPSVPKTSQGKYRLNSNLVRSIDGHQRRGGSGAVDNSAAAAVAKYANTMSHRIGVRGGRHNLLDNRTKKRHHHYSQHYGYAATGRNKRRHHRGGASGGGGCQYGDTLENRLKCVREENKRFLIENEVIGSSGAAPSTRNNRDLIRSLDTAASRRKRRRRRNRRRQVRLAGSENMTREERRARRREEKRRLKEIERRRRKARKRAERKKRREQERLLRAEAAAAEKNNRRRRRRETDSDNGSGGTCQTRHIDRCSWPQCNRSCPKLHNPLTGWLHAWITS